MTDRFDERDGLAADYALGVLEGDARARAEALIAEDPAFAAEVEAWQARLAPLADGIAPVAPPDRVWRQIESVLEPAPLAAPDRRAAVEAGRGRRTGLLSSLWFWRWSTAFAAATALVLALVMALDQRPAAPDDDRRFVAVLDADGAQPAWLVTVDLATRQLTIRPVTEIAPGDRVHELWMIAGAEAAPESLGLLNTRNPIVVPLARAVDPGAPPVLAISLEPAGGSPTGRPTGPVVYQGRLLPLQQ